MTQKKEWSFKEFWNVIEKFNEIAETGSYSSLADIYKKLAEEFKCTEEDVLSGFNSLVDDDDQLVKTFEGMRQLSRIFVELSENGYCFLCQNPAYPLHFLLCVQTLVRVYQLLHQV